MASTTSAVFREGKLEVKLINVETKSTDNISTPPPKPLLIATPNVEGEYPVLLFLHGFCLRNSYYSRVFHHVASHGFIVVGPQLYVFGSLPFEGDEIANAAATTNWLSKGLQAALPVNVCANLFKLALAGHSRGGEAAFALALRRAQTSLEYKVLLGIDPIAGSQRPPILNKDPRSFDIKMPILVVGCGLGGENKFVVPHFALNGEDHKEFFYESRPPVCHFVASDYGHMDMLDDDSDLWSRMISSMCKKGDSREPMRRFVGGIIVAFLKAYLKSDSGDLRAIVDEPDIAPVKLDSVEFLEN